LSLRGELNVIAYSYRIGDGHIVEPEFSYNTTLNGTAVFVRSNIVPTSGRFCYGSFLQFSVTGFDSLISFTVKRRSSLQGSLSAKISAILVKNPGVLH
jgi:hypothetical protein